MMMNKQIIKAIPVKKNGKNGQLFLGPVDNLEMYLRPDWWRRIFNSMYLKTDADVVDDKQITKNEVDLFTSILNAAKRICNISISPAVREDIPLNSHREALPT